ncbi:MAG: hypothetical protein HYY01_05570 [Chloroflexi bacterium]|nr:hypothetical protein [Chloroflexota bacterium]
MRTAMKDYRRLVRRRQKALAFFERLSDAELDALGRFIDIVRERSALAVAAAAHEMSGTGAQFEHPAARDLFNMLIETSPDGSNVASPNGTKEKYWLFMDLALAIWKRLQEQEEATQEILESPELMAQIREARKDYEVGRRENFIPWKA